MARLQESAARARRFAPCRDERPQWGVRILSLLPSATEMVYLLGLEDSLVGVTHECDWPAPAAFKPRVTRSLLPPGATPLEVDSLVSAAAGGGDPVQRLDRELIADLAPDLVLTQDLCGVCAVPRGHLDAALAVLGLECQVLSFDPACIADVLANVVSLGDATGTGERARGVVAGLRSRLDAVEPLVRRKQRRRALALEWGDPPYNAGHWVPEMIAMAGCEPLLAVPGEYSYRVTWEAVRASDPEIILYIPCGYDLERACKEAEVLLDRPEVAGAERIVVGGSGGYFSRPGPRLVDGVEALAASFHGEGDFAPVTARLR